jgi:diguanylate cyclase (GGDEF)-like protein/PAS domain S-box-containing protein
MVGLDVAIGNFLERSTTVYATEMAKLSGNSAAYIYLTTYGPHVLEPLLDAVVDEYQNIGENAIAKIVKFETFIWLVTLITLLIELIFIFHPLEGQVRKALSTLQDSIEELTNTRKRLLAAQQLAMVGDWQFDIAGDNLTWSDQVYEICGVSREELQPTMNGALRCIHSNDRSAVKVGLIKVMRTLSPMTMEYRVLRANGEERLVLQHVAAQEHINGNGLVICGTIQDITERRELSNRLEKLSEHIPGFIFQLSLSEDKNPLVPYASKGIQSIYGIDAQAIHDNPRAMLDLVHAEDKARLQNGIYQSSKTLQTWHGQYRIMHPQRGIIWVEGHATPEELVWGGTLWHGYIWDITERKHSENQIMKLALYDPLTGVANRRLLKEKLHYAIATSRRNQKYGAVIMLDLDNFKMLNDTKGHDVGDALLIEVTKRLLASIRETDTVARLGGDEFVVVLEWLNSEKSKSQGLAMHLAEKIRFSLSEPYILGKENHEHHGSASIGVVVFLDNSKDVSELLKRADLAMYEAKDLGRNRACLFSKKRQNLVYQRTAMANDLKKALEHNEFSLYLQPQFTPTLELGGAEALLPWFPPGKAPISPAEFIPLAEQTGLILPLGEWVLTKACQLITELCKYPIPDDFAVAVNISARQFSHEGFVETVKTIISANKVDVRRIKLELTESCLFQDLERGQAILAELRDMGIFTELDDFGTGYSSLNSLKRLPLSTIKLDKSLIKDIEGKDIRGKAIVRAAVAMAKAMSMKIIAEGVETVIQKDFLINEGCDLLQGYLLARPMVFDDFLHSLLLPSYSPTSVPA